MSDRSLRGMRLGAQSMETEAGVEPAPRQQVEYRSEDGESVVVTFAAEADIPDSWTTKSGKEALRVDGKAPDLPETKPQRTHWDMLLEQIGRASCRARAEIPAGIRCAKERKDRY